jgi:hypothetical protein
MSCKRPPSHSKLARSPTSLVLPTTTTWLIPGYEDLQNSLILFSNSRQQVQAEMGGDYVVVYARPKTSRSCPRGEGVETFAPNFQNRIEITTERPKEDSAEAARIGHIIANEGFFGVGVLYFNGRKIDLYFEPPYGSNKLVSEVRTETLKNEQKGIEPANILDRVIDDGVRVEGSTARFGIKDMCHVFGIMHGFYFIALDLAIFNYNTGEPDIHHIIGVKLPDEGEVASAFILKQVVEFPHYSWYRWQKFTTQDELKRKALLPSVDKAVSDYYEEEEPGFREKKFKRSKDTFYDSMDWMNLA